MPAFEPDDIHGFFADFADQAASYVDKNGAHSPVCALPLPGKNLGTGTGSGAPDEPFRGQLAEYTVVYLSALDIPTKPQYMGKITMSDGTVYIVQQTADESGLWRCYAKSDERVSF